MKIPNETIFTGDNLYIMRGMDSCSVDLIYLDPPFNSNRTYEAPIGSKAAGAAFKDAWTLEDTDDAWWGELAEKHPPLYKVIDAVGELGNKGDKAYLIYMAIRLLEMHRILKSSGSIYLHCDDTMSHGLKLVLDAIFGKKNYLNQIIWKRTHAHNDPKRFGRNADTIYLYSKTVKYVFNTIYLPYSEKYINDFFSKEDERGRYTLVVLTGPKTSKGESDAEWKGYRPSLSNRSWSVPKRLVNRLLGEEKASKMSITQRLDTLNENDYIVFSKNGIPRFKEYLKEMQGVAAQAIWLDVPPIAANAKERVGYPTQKPVELLKRIVLASSNKGDMVFDPFCGCASACPAAHDAQREWIGVDISPIAVKLIERRMREERGFLVKLNHRTDIPIRSDQVTKPSRDIKHTLFGRQKGKCKGCLGEMSFRNMTIDHIIAKARGGGDTDSNLQLLCAACNSMKGSRDMEFLLAKLKAEGIIK